MKKSNCGLYVPTERYGKPNIWRLQRLVGNAPPILEYQRRQGNAPSYYYPQGDRTQPVYSFSQVKSTVEPVFNPGATSALQRWWERVGSDEANRICAESKAAGEMGHGFLENWSKQDAALSQPVTPIHMWGYRQALEQDILPYLDQSGEPGLSITDEHGELRPLSEVFVADFEQGFIGRLDLVTRISASPFNNKRVLLELKGSRKQKKYEHTKPHIIQAIAYQSTFNKIANEYPEQLEALDGVAIAYMYQDGHGDLIPIFGEELQEYEQQWQQWLNCFHDLLGGSKAA